MKIKMNRKTFLVAVVAMLSNLIKEKMFTSYATIGPFYEAWIGSSAFSTALAVLLSSFVTLPAHYEESSAPILYLYYTAMSALVTLLALKLLWMPVVDLLSELNIILSKTMFYVNKAFLCNAKTSYIKRLGTFLATKTALVWSTNIVGLLALYAVSSDVRNYIGMYMFHFPRTSFFARLKDLTVRIRSCPLHIVNLRRFLLLREKANFTYKAKEIKPSVLKRNPRSRKPY